VIILEYYYSYFQNKYLIFQKNNRTILILRFKVPFANREILFSIEKLYLCPFIRFFWVSKVILLMRPHFLPKVFLLLIY